MNRLKFITTSDGIRYAFRQAVSSSPEVVMVLVHGVGTSSDYWTALVDHLPETWHVVVPDIPGSGFSRPVKGDLEIATVSTVLLDALEAALREQSGEIVLVGHSLGALVVLEMARQRPTFSSVVVLVDPVLYHAEEVLTRFDRFIKDWPYSVVVLSQFAGVILNGRLSALLLRSRLLRKLLLGAQLGKGPDVPAATLGICLQGTRGWPHFRVIPVIRAARRVHLSDTIRAVQSSVALVRGSLDPLTSDEEAHRLSSEGQLVYNGSIDSAGHSPMLNMPRELAASLESIVSENVGRME